MNARWFWVCLSAAALIGGFSILLLFIYFYAVPHMLTGDFLSTNCMVNGIDIQLSERGNYTCKHDVTSSLRDCRMESQYERFQELEKQYREISRKRRHVKKTLISGDQPGDQRTEYRSKETQWIIATNPNSHDVKTSRGTQMDARTFSPVTMVNTLESVTSSATKGDFEWDTIWCVELMVAFLRYDNILIKDAKAYEGAWQYYRTVFGDEKVST